MYVYMYVCMNTCMYVLKCVYMYLCIYVYRQTCISMCICVIKNSITAKKFHYFQHSVIFGILLFDEFLNSIFSTIPFPQKMTFTGNTEFWKFLNFQKMQRLKMLEVHNPRISKISEFPDISNFGMHMHMHPL